MADETKAVVKKGRTRSPAYPSFDLEAAIAKVRIAYEANDRHPMDPESLASYLKASATSSTFLQGISTLKQFGLLDDSGWGSKRRLTVSDLALDILIAEDESARKADAIKQAALNPAVHAEIWQKYQGRLPAKDESIRFYLLREREDGVFNRTQVDGIIAELRATVAFAKLSPDDKIEGFDDEKVEDSQENDAESCKKPSVFNSFLADQYFFRPQPPVKPLPKTDKIEKKMRDLAIPLMDDEVAYLRVPAPLSEENYEYLVAQIAMFKRGLVARTQQTQGMPPRGQQDQEDAST